MEALIRDLSAYKPQKKTKNNLEKKLLIMHTNFFKEEKWLLMHL